MFWVWLPVQLDKRVQDTATRMGVTFSAALRELLELGLTEIDDDATIDATIRLSDLRAAIAHARQNRPGEAA
jgi:hypothetical protein